MTVVTLTRGNVAFLRRAIASVRDQDYAGDIEHLVTADDVEVDVAAVAGEPRDGRTLEITTDRRELGEITTDPPELWEVYPRTARLMNRTVRRSHGAWIAFLDDDNEYEPDHVSSLMARAEAAGTPVVHSSRAILNADGTPYLEERFPWALTPESARLIYRDLCARGVWERGTNILHDRAGPLGTGPVRNSTVMTHRDPVLLVDTSVYFLRRDVALAHPLPEVQTPAEIADRTVPDDQLLVLLLQAGVPVASTNLPTLKYYLGGMSNVHAQPPAGGTTRDRSGTPAPKPQHRRTRASAADLERLLLTASEAARRAVLDQPAHARRTRAAGHDDQYQVDVLVDRAVVDVLLRGGVGVLSEESGLHARERPILVVVDPIDGSTNCSRGIGPYGPSLCAVDEHGPLTAVVADLASGRRFTAKRGQGACCDGVALATDPQRPLGVVVTGDPVPQLERDVWTRLHGASAHDLCGVASGAFDAYLDHRNTQSVWDYLGALLVLTEAGGAVRERDGRPLFDLDARSDRRLIAGGCPAQLARLETLAEHAGV